MIWHVYHRTYGRKIARIMAPDSAGEDGAFKALVMMGPHLGIRLPAREELQFMREVIVDNRKDPETVFDGMVDFIDWLAKEHEKMLEMVKNCKHCQCWPDDSCCLCGKPGWYNETD